MTKECETERSQDGKCESCGELYLTDNTRLVEVKKPTWASFYMCLLCLQDEIDEGSAMTVYF